MTLGEQIKQARDNKNLSQEELAEKLGVSRQAVSKWENDSAIPQGFNREMLSHVLELDILKNEIEPTGKRGMNWTGWLGWIVAIVMAVVLVAVLYSWTWQNRNAEEGTVQVEKEQSSTMQHEDEALLKPQESEETIEQQTTAESENQPKITYITFYDENQNKVEPEALWYNAARIESILIQWEGGSPNHIKMFGTPSGTETMELTELLLTKSVLDGNGVALLDADVLKGTFQTHVYFELYFGDSLIVASDLYNIFYDESFE